MIVRRPLQFSLAMRQQLTTADGVTEATYNLDENTQEISGEWNRRAIFAPKSQSRASLLLS